ncbi:acyltransferase family protein [Vaginisenegalia massiliensis]|uniref:acyltransferase family protein n=1 Tax=Vaginisenegalia massiliensis TaxID=2058294 RepID=UPI000F51B9FD|nr:acyltransferase family protein [Vaginisenegalia massiliensis]
MNKSVAGKRIAVFDGIKGVAILTIIFYYFFQHIVPGGFAAVNSFLFVAGFFNFRHFYLRDRQGKDLDYRGYYISRFRRLFYPTLALILGTVTYIALFARDYLVNLRNMALTSLVFFNNYYQILNNQSYFVQAVNPSPFVHLWYVSLYGQLVLLTPVMILLFYSWHKKPQITINILLIVSLLSAILLGYWYQDGQDPTHVYYSVLTRGFAYTLGGAVGLVLPDKLSPKPLSNKAKQSFNIVGSVGMVLAILMVKFMYGVQPFAYRFGMTLFTIVTALVLVSSIHPATIWNKFFTFKPFVFFGKRSFSYYLCYYPVHLMMPKNIHFINQHLLLNLTIQFLLIMFFAEISYQLFEKESLPLPVGQDLKLHRLPARLRQIRYDKQIPTLIKVITVAYLFCFLVGSVGMIFSPEKRADTQSKIEKIVKVNQEKALKEQQGKEKVETPINNIPGLTRQELLFANGLDVTFIGDSVLLTGMEQIKQVFPKAVVDGKVGRQLYQSVEVVNNLEQNKLVKPIVVTILGSNGTFTQGQLNDYIEAIGTDKEQYFLTVYVDRAWTDDANSRLIEASQKYGNVKLIDWASSMRDHADWLYEDGVHPNEIGSLELAKFIAKEIYRQR